MGRKHGVAGAVLFACVGCNNAPPVPDNPLSVGAPDFGVTKTLAVAPPPISGGTMLLSRDGKTVVAADPDRDLISFVNLSGRTVRAQAALSPGDEPGRLVEDGAGRVHVALRGSGELATLSLATGQLLERRHVCPQPRGVAYDGKTDQVIIACATGEFVTFPAASGSAVQSLTIEPDLRDVVVEGDTIFVSKFRTAEILSLTRSGVISKRTSLPVDGSGSLPAMAWRMRATADHQLAVSYQLDAVGFLPTTPGGYGNSGSGAIVRSAVANISMVDMTNIQRPSSFDPIVLPVDLAVAPSSPTAVNNTVLVGAGNWKSNATFSYATVGPFLPNARRALVEGQLIAAELGQDGTIFLQSREPALLYVVQPGGGSQDDTILATITLSDVSREDTGHTIFHTNSGGSLACASCHGEGGDDAQTWNFDGKKPRRTPSLLGTVKDTAPYHWDADFRDLQALSHEVYTRRMGGRLLAHDQVAALKGWLEPLPGPKRPAVDVAAKARGELLFRGKADCASCHSGPSYTNNATVDVGTGGALQVPPLVGVGARTPLMHTGCAKTLMDRFTLCATDTHGHTANLSTSEVGDLVAFLDSL